MTPVSNVFTAAESIKKGHFPGAGQQFLVFVKLPVLCMPSGLYTAMPYHVSSPEPL